MEMKKGGINVSTIVGVSTAPGIGGIGIIRMSGAYEEQATKAAKGMRSQYSGNMMSDPKIISRAISKAVNSRRPRPRYLIGMGAKPLVFLHTILPTRLFDYIMKHAS